MKKPIATCLLTLALAAAAPLGASVQVVNRAWRNANVFGIRIGENQEFLARVDNVNSISLQEYVAGAFRVREICVDIANSPLQLRIYHMESMDALTAMSEAAAAANPVGISIPELPPALKALQEKVKTPVDNVVATTPTIKDYPVTTHARTIEYKIASKDDLIDLYNALSERWLNPGPKSASGSSSRQPAGGSSSSSSSSSSSTTPADEKEPQTLNRTLFIVK